jgi:hypothetical protein
MLRTPEEKAAKAAAMLSRQTALRALSTNRRKIRAALARAEGRTVERVIREIKRDQPLK